VSRGSGWVRRTTREAVYLRDGYACVYCGPVPAYDLTLDHTDGPDLHHPRHLVTACRSCNSSRQDTPIRTWCEGRGLCASTVWARIRNLQAVPIAPLRRALATLRRLGIDVHAHVLDPRDPFDAPAADAPMEAL
jgi:hypothetical protein